MFSTVISAALRGISAELVRVEADTSDGLPIFNMVGYLSSEVKEAGERVRTAIRNSGFRVPPKKIVINLSPADIRKRGTAFDLPIAVAILISLGILPDGCAEKMLLAGELGLDGSVRKIPGVLPMADYARHQGINMCIVPESNAGEGAVLQNMQIIGVKSLSELCGFLLGQNIIHPARRKESWTEPAGEDDFADISGQIGVKRAAEIAAAGGHHMIMSGPPGTGKSMIAKRIPTIMPRMSEAESLEVTKIYSIAGLTGEGRNLITARPFREVHHTVTQSAVLGGGLIPVPGEISMAHKGVLFIDELAECRRSVIEVLRQPLEEKRVRINRRQYTYEFPADCMLVAAMNPCPCGNYPDYNRCICSDGQIRRYQERISAPFLDRIDIAAEVFHVKYDELQDNPQTETSGDIRRRVERARQIQRERYIEKSGYTNAALNTGEIKEVCCLGTQEQNLMRRAFDTYGLTARTYHKVLKVARTIADLEVAPCITAVHLQEALGYRYIKPKGRI